jgi:hypothetical protein
MFNYTDINITDYLNKKGIQFSKTGSSHEISTNCVFNGCDEDSRRNERHLYFNTETGQYDCKKCGSKGNIVTLAKHFGDNLNEMYSHMQTSKPQKQQRTSKKKITLAEVEQFHKQLPENIRVYLGSRLIPDAIIDQQRIGWANIYGSNWITIPVFDENDALTFVKLRKDPLSNADGPKMMVFPGGDATIYGWDVLKQKPREVVVCEGEFDRLVLAAQGIPAITSTAGAGTFKPEWVKALAAADHIIVCFDNDDAGTEGSKNLVQALLDMDCSQVSTITLPQLAPDGAAPIKDVTDYFKAGATKEAFLALARTVDPSSSGLRIASISRASKSISVEEWRETIGRNFPDCSFAAEAGAAVISQLLIKDITNPFALVLVDVPSSGKTITLNFFDNLPELSYATDKFTPASFVTNATNVSREKLADLDLLPRIRYKLFLIRDLATIFSKRDDDLAECLGILTRILDGEGLKTDTGIHGQRQYTGCWLFMVLAASTPIPSRIWKMMGSLGSRLFFLRMNTRDKSEFELAKQLMDATYKEKENECRQATKNMLYTLWKQYPEGVAWDRANDNKECITHLTRCASLLARLRGVISVWQEKPNSDGVREYDYSPPVIEKPDRISQLFYNHCRGHALLCGRKRVELDDLRYIIEIAIDSAPTQRAKLFRTLIDAGGTATTTEVEKQLACAKPTALKEMETLKALGICEMTETGGHHPGQPEKMIKLKPEFMWFCTEECKRLRGIVPPPIQDEIELPDF